MKNKSSIKGNGNQNIQGNKKSQISIGNKHESKPSGKFWVVAGVVIAFVALLVQAIIGWDVLIKWFYAK